MRNRAAATIIPAPVSAAADAGRGGWWRYADQAQATLFAVFDSARRISPNVRTV